MSSYRNLIANAWNYTQQNKKLIWWYGFFPAIFTTTAGILYVLYQFFALKKSPVFDNAEQSFFYDVMNFGYTTVQSSGGWLVPLIITVIILLLTYLLLPTLLQGGVIQIIAHDKQGKPVQASDGFKFGMISFLRLFEYHILIKTFGVMAIVGEMAFVLRNLGMDAFKLLLPLFILIFVVGVILTLLFTYADLFIVIEGAGVMDSIKKSTRMVIMNLQHAFLMTILMVIIGLRIILQVLFVLAVPALAFAVGGYFVSVSMPGLAIVISTLIGIMALLIAAYLGGIVNIFAYTVWTYSFLYLREHTNLETGETINPEAPTKAGQTQLAG